MPTPSEIIAQALAGEQKRQTASNPWLAAGTGLMRSQPKYDFGNPYAELAATIGQQALGGFMGGYGQGQVETGMQDYATGLASALQSSDPSQALLSSPQYASIGTALRGVQTEQDRELEDLLTRNLASTSMQASAYNGQPMQGFKLNRQGGQVTFEPIYAQEQPVTEPNSPLGALAVNSPDRETQAYAQGVMEARALGVPRTQQGVYGQRRAEAVRGQIKGAQEEALKARQEADKLLTDAQQLSTLSDIVGDSYTGLMGQAEYKTKSFFNSTDPTFVTAKEITGLGMSGIRNLRSDAQITENERKALLQALPSGTQPAQFNQNIADKWAQMATIKNTYADWLEDAAQMGMSSSQARRQWAEARKGVDMFSTDPRNGKLIVADPEQWRSRMASKLYGGAPEMPNGVGDITRIPRQTDAQEQPPGPAPKGYKWVFKP